MRQPIAFLSLGPGDPELLTVKAARLLQAADIVLVPATMGKDGNPTSRAAQIVSEWCSKEKVHLYALPMSKERQAAQVAYDVLYQDVVRLYYEGQQVVVAVEGDVSIYASIHYILERLQSTGVPVIQVAGIPSFIAAAATAGISLICQHERMVVLPGDADIAELERLLTSRHVVVVMKLSQCQQVLKDYLLQHPDTVCHYFENIGTPETFHTTEHNEIRSRQMPYFSLSILYPA